MVRQKLWFIVIIFYCYYCPFDGLRTNHNATVDLSRSLLDFLLWEHVCCKKCYYAEIFACNFASTFLLLKMDGWKGKFYFLIHWFVIPVHEPLYDKSCWGESYLTNFLSFWFWEALRALQEIPRALEHLEGKYCGIVLLKGPSGKVWRVEMTEKNNDVFLQQGWRRFLNDNYVKVGYCLVFRYYGRYRFSVKILDTSACERKSMSHVRSNCESVNSCHDTEDYDTEKKGDQFL